MAWYTPIPQNDPPSKYLPYAHDPTSCDFEI